MGPNEYMAEKLMEIKSETELMSFLTTMWMGKYVMLIWDKLNGGVVTVWGLDDLEDTDTERLYELVSVFVGKENNFARV